jgi:uncharacterized protein
VKASRLFTVLAATALSVGTCAWVVSGYYEQKFLGTGPNGPETPATLGIPYERVAIASDKRHLDGYLVRAPKNCRRTTAVLIFHGVGETISYWPRAQQLLFDRCVSSLVFDYSGHGDSSKAGSVSNLDADALAAYSYFASRFRGTSRLCVLGHSMGNGPMLSAIAGFKPQPTCVVVANAFSSLRDLGVRGGAPRVLMAVVPDYWDNVINVTSVRSPLLVVRSDADSVVPAAMGGRIFEAASEPKRLLLVHGFRHNALYRTPTMGWWAPVLKFIEGERV